MPLLPIGASSSRWTCSVARWRCHSRGWVLKSRHKCEVPRALKCTLYGCRGRVSRDDVLFGRPAPAASPHQARRRPTSAEADRSANSAGRARRPWTSHASTTKSALPPARHRINSSSHRARPTPGSGKGFEGSVDTRHLVADAVGYPKAAASVCRRQRRTAIAIEPEASAASDSRRDDVIESRATSATTAPSPP
jgi:hypothetical protein